MSDQRAAAPAGDRRGRRALLASLSAPILAPGLYAGGTPPMPGRDTLNVAIIGFGKQGEVLMDSCMKPGIPGIHLRAICDIRLRERAQYGCNRLGKFHVQADPFEDYRELLSRRKELDLDVVIVASPDWLHAEHANACLEAGLHVYCEKEMSNHLDQALSMVHTARRTGRCLQIGHQRRSNPRYRHAIDTLIRDRRLLGRVVRASARWHKAPAEFEKPADKYILTRETLARHGYGSMEELLNWRWFRKFGGGPMVDLGSHQIDLFLWAFGGPPTAIIAAGGRDHYTTREWYDNVTAVYEFQTPEGPARAVYEVCTTNQHGGFRESFMGTDGAITISEVEKNGNAAWREPEATDGGARWIDAVQHGHLLAPQARPSPAVSRRTVLDVNCSAPAGAHVLPVVLEKPAHTPHLENFVAAIRDGEPLNCPPEMAYECAVAVHKANEAVEAGRRLTFAPSEFTVI